MTSSRISLVKALASAPVFVDGDWVESKDQDADGDVRLIQLADVGDGVYVDKSNRFLTSSAATRLKCTFLEPGDVLIARMPDPLGRACIFPGDVKRAVTVVDVCVIRVDPTRMYAPWLVHCINSSTIRNQIAGYVTGTTRQRISRGNLGKIEIELPSLAEQKRIAAILDQADALRAKRREALAQLDSLTQSIFIEMFGDPVSNERGWPTKRLEEAVEGKYGVKAGPFGSSLKKEDYSESGYRVYGQEQVIAGRFDIGNYYIRSSKYEQLKSCAVMEGDLLVSLVGSFGKVLIVPAGIEPGIINPRLLKITPCKSLLESVFLSQLIGSKAIQDKLISVSHGGTMGILNAGLLKELEIILPPITQQRSFAGRLDSVRRLQTTHNAALQELDRLFASLQHRAFSGEL